MRNLVEKVKASHRAPPLIRGGEDGARRMAAEALSRPVRAAKPASTERSALASPGHGLGSSLQASMEARFGQSFAEVRVLTDQEAAESALAMGADAYTYGRTITFADGHYAPHSDAGHALIAHELAHVVQQKTQAPQIQRQRASRARVFDRGYRLYLSPQGTVFHSATGNYDLSDQDLAHLVRRGGFYFIVMSRISLITPPEVRRAGPSGVLLEFTPADYAAMSTRGEATVARIVRERLGITVPRMTLATGPDRDFSRPELPDAMARALDAPAHGATPAGDEAAALRRRARETLQEPTLEGAARRGGDLPIHEIGWSDRMSQSNLFEMSSGARGQWYVQKLGRYQAQLYESARRHRIPTQLLAVVVLNELADINPIDVAQSGEGADWGSLGIAQVQVTTAMSENLVDVTRDEAENEYRRYLHQTGHDHEPNRPLTELERRMGRRRRVGRQLQVPQVGIEAAAREIEILIDRMGANLDSPWQRRFNFRARGANGDAIYGSVGAPNATVEQREGMLAMMVAGAYNSPNVIDTGNPDGFRNALIHGGNAQSHAIQLYRLGLFRSAETPSSRAEPTSPRPTGTSPSATPPVTGMRFDGSRLSVYGGRAVASLSAVSGLRPNNPRNTSHRDHTRRASQAIPDVGPIPEGSYFMNPGEVQRAGFNPAVWGPVRLRIHGTVLTDLEREVRTRRDGGFFLHQDVARDGTAGCVGLQNRADTTNVFARIDATTEQFPLEVRYPRTGGARRR
jgi:hypothetical protein